MKKTIIVSCTLIVIVIVFAVILSFILKPHKTTLSGIYSDVEIGTGTVLDFSDDTVTVTYMSMGIKVGEATGRYSISEGKLTVKFDDSSSVSDMYAGDHTIIIEEDRIVIDGSVYFKEKQE